MKGGTFPIITEFSDPEMVENYRPEPEHNPCKLLPRGVRVFYCDPYCSCQKPHIGGSR